MRSLGYAARETKVFGIGLRGCEQTTESPRTRWKSNPGEPRHRLKKSRVSCESSGRVTRTLLVGRVSGTGELNRGGGTARATSCAFKLSLQVGVDNRDQKW